MNSAAASGRILKSSAKEIYAKNCARCHGVDGRGDTELGQKYVVPDMTNAAWQKRHSDKRMALSIAEGRDDMPAFGGKISAKDINALVRYIRLLKK